MLYNIIKLNTGRGPSPMEKTYVCVMMDETGTIEDEDSKWAINLKHKSGNDITIGIIPASNCVIGEWNFSIVTYSDVAGSDHDRMFIYDYPEDITILLNPWCESKRIVIILFKGILLYMLIVAYKCVIESLASLHNKVFLFTINDFDLFH